MSSAVDLHSFLEELQTRRRRILHLAGPSTDPTLLAEVDELNEQLVVAEEELRVQQEELEATRLALVSLGGERDDRASDSQAYALTDPDGVVLHATEAVERLVGRQGLTATRRPIATWFPLSQRPAIRALIARVMATGARQEVCEVVVGRCQEHQVSLDVVVEPTSAATGEVVLRWELIPVSEQADQGWRSPPLVADAAQLVTFFSTFCVALDTCRSPEGMYPVIVAAASRLMPSGGHVGLTVVGARRAVAPAAWSSDAAKLLDSFQLEQGEGPLAEAVAGLAASSVQTFSPDGVVTVAALAVPLVALGRPVGYLTFYAEVDEGITAARVAALGTLAGHASRALAHAAQVGNLRTAMLSRQDIAEAVGIIMERDRVTPEAAFNQLRQRSQELNIKLREIARGVVETGQSPSAIVGP